MKLQDLFEYYEDLVEEFTERKKLAEKKMKNKAR